MSQDRRTVRVIVLTIPTAVFPFLGEPEINFIARVHDDHIPPEGDSSSNPKWWLGSRIVSVVLGSTVDSLPGIGTEVEATEYVNFYQGRDGSHVRRLCLTS